MHCAFFIPPIRICFNNTFYFGTIKLPKKENIKVPDYEGNTC